MPHCIDIAGAQTVDARHRAGHTGQQAAPRTTLSLKPRTSATPLRAASPPRLSDRAFRPSHCFYACSDHRGCLPSTWLRTCVCWGRVHSLGRQKWVTVGNDNEEACLRESRRRNMCNKVGHIVPLFFEWNFTQNKLFCILRTQVRVSYFIFHVKLY